MTTTPDNDYDSEYTSVGRDKKINGRDHEHYTTINIGNSEYRKAVTWSQMILTILLVGSLFCITVLPWIIAYVVYVIIHLLERLQ